MEGMIKNGGNTMLYNSVVLHVLDHQHTQAVKNMLMAGASVGGGLRAMNRCGGDLQAR